MHQLLGSTHLENLDNGSGKRAWVRRNNDVTLARSNVHAREGWLLLLGAHARADGGAECAAVGRLLAWLKQLQLRLAFVCCGHPDAHAERLVEQLCETEQPVSAT